MSTTGTPNVDPALAYLTSLPLCRNDEENQPRTLDHALDLAGPLALAVQERFGLTDEQGDAIVFTAIYDFLRRLTPEEVYRLGTNREAVDAVNAVVVAARPWLLEAGA